MSQHGLSLQFWDPHSLCYGCSWPKCGFCRLSKNHPQRALCNSCLGPVFCPPWGLPPPSEGVDTSHTVNGFIFVLLVKKNTELPLKVGCVLITIAKNQYIPFQCPFRPSSSVSLGPFRRPSGHLESGVPTSSHSRLAGGANVHQGAWGVMLFSRHRAAVVPMVSVWAAVHNALCEHALLG